MHAMCNNKIAPIRAQHRWREGRIKRAWRQRQPSWNVKALQRSAYKPLLLGSLLRKFFNGFFSCAPPLLGLGGLAFFCLLPPPIGLVMILLPRFANPGKRRCDVAAARAVHPAPLIANIIEGDSRVLFDPAEPAPDTNAGRGDGQ
jgi:hypothetical protein